LRLVFELGKERIELGRGFGAGPERASSLDCGSARRTDGRNDVHCVRQTMKRARYDPRNSQMTGEMKVLRDIIAFPPTRADNAPC